jgi:hypothetical protein
MSTKTRWLTIVLAAGLLLGFGLIGASAAPSNGSPPQHPYLSPEIIISDFNNKEILPDIAYNSKHNEYLVVWHTTGTAATRTVRGARISANGQMLANFQINGHPSKDSVQPSVAYDPVHDHYLTVFLFDAAGDGSNMDLLGRLIPWEGPDPNLNSFLISDWSTHQWTPEVAYGRAVEEFLVVWANEYQSGALPMYISGRRVRAADGSFFGSGSDLTINHPSQNRVNPAVTYNLARNEYLVIYDNGLDILGTRYTGHIDHDFGGEFAIAGWPDAETIPDVAACYEADQYLVTWQSLQGGTNDAIYGRFLDGSAKPGNVYQIDDTTSAERAASVSCNDAGTRYLVAWQTEYTNLKFGVWARFVSPNEQLGPLFAVQEPFNQSHRTNPAVAGGRTDYLSVWEDERGNTGFWDIHGRLITPYANFIPIVRRP